MDMPKQDGENIFIEELDEKYKVYYNYMTANKVEEILLQCGFIIEDKQIVQQNENASSYASGLMVYRCTI